MATTEEVKKLAALARIRVPEERLEQFTKEFDAILAYVGQLEKLDLPNAADKAAFAPTEASGPLRNVYRADDNATPPGAWTKKLVDAFPQKEDDYLVVKQIISHE